MRFSYDLDDDDEVLELLSSEQLLNRPVDWTEAFEAYTALCPGRNGAVSVEQLAARLLLTTLAPVPEGDDGEGGSGDGEELAPSPRAVAGGGGEGRGVAEGAAALGPLRWAPGEGQVLDTQLLEPAHHCTLLMLLPQQGAGAEEPHQVRLSGNCALLPFCCFCVWGAAPASK